MTMPFKSLGYYYPQEDRGYFGEYIGEGILAKISHLNLIPLVDPAHGPQTESIWCDEELHAEVRRFVTVGGQGAAWHQDGDLASGSIMDHAEVLWSAVTPTEFRASDGSIYIPAPFEIVIARNLACHHRTPPYAPKPPARRWFFRQRVVVPSHLNLP